MALVVVFVFKIHRSYTVYSGEYWRNSQMLRLLKNLDGGGPRPEAGMA
jgi:hypothetical protein